MPHEMREVSLILDGSHVWASCLTLALYGSAALVKVVPPPPAASTLTMLAQPGTAALREHEANL
jgi:hypothetical protein